MGHVEIGEDRHGAQILHLEFLIAPRLAAKLTLPGFQFHIGRTVKPRQSRIRGFL
jgi:hypothetical protein